MGTIYRICMAALFAVATPSFAAAEENWNGFYLGAHGGWGGSEFVLLPVNPRWFATAFNGTAPYTTSENGNLVGVQGGVLKQLPGDWVGGFEFSIDLFEDGRLRPSPADDVVYFRTSIEWAASATARIGHSHGALLPYLEAGVASGLLSVDLVDTGCNTCDFNTEKWHFGYVLGGGVDYRLSKNAIIGFNYRFTNYASRLHTDTAEPAFGPETYKVDAQVHTVTLRLNWLFHQDGM